MNDICVIILTRNEEKNIEAALKSVAGWASEIYVVDSFSTDGTVSLAQALGIRSLKTVTHEFQDFSRQWNWALQTLPIEAAWTLKLDADERLTEQFKKEVDALLAKDDGSLDGIYFRREIYFMGRRLRWGGVNSNYDLRLWRTGKAHFESRSVNEHAIVSGKTTKIRARVLHHDYKDLSSWLEKHNRYSSMEALEIASGNITGEVMPRLFGMPDERRMWLRKAYRKTPFRWLLYFCYKYFFQLGLLDGIVGFRYWFLKSSYLYWIDLKLAEIREPATGRGSD